MGLLQMSAIGRALHRSTFQFGGFPRSRWNYRFGPNVLLAPISELLPAAGATRCVNLPVNSGPSGAFT